MPTPHDPWAEEHGAPESVAKFLLYSYEWIDFHAYTKPAAEVLQGWPHASKFVSALKKRWKEVGWDGDGVVTTIWLPPFLVPELDTTRGLIIWHVKQLEDGISWIASKHPLKCLGDEGLLPEPEYDDRHLLDNTPEYRPPSIP